MRKCFDSTRWAYRANEALGDHAHQRRGKNERIDAELEEASDRCRCVVRVQCGEHHVPRQRGLESDLGGFGVAHLADHDHVGVLSEHVAQCLGEGQRDLGLHGHLIELVNDDFNRVLDRDDVHLGGCDGRRAA